MTFNPSDGYNDNRVCLSVEGEFQGYAIRAYSSPDAEGRTFIDDGDQEIGEISEPDRYGAPFPVDIVFQNGVYPMEGDISDIRDEVGSDIGAKFEAKVDDVFEKLGDDPVEDIMSLEADEI